MKANELMIGDWVLVHKPTCKGHRVDYISEMEEEIGADGEIYDSCDIKPIPLTTEILEKNRMKVFEHRNPWQESKNLIKKWYSKDGKFYVSYYRVGNMFTYTVGNNVSRICGIKNVHELQHALRLCGIEKEIEL